MISIELLFEWHRLKRFFMNILQLKKVEITTILKQNAMKRKYFVCDPLYYS